MTLVDLLSDTTYRQQAKDQLDKQLDNGSRFPVKRAQIYGLRQIARQQPGKVQDFANHQRERARRKQENASEKVKLDLQAEIEFWTLVANLCSYSPSDWSVNKEGHPHLPVELREENIPTKQECRTNEDRSRRNKLKKSQKEWLVQWENEHIPTFFERFCTHALYRLGLAENSQEE